MKAEGFLPVVVNSISFASFVFFHIIIVWRIKNKGEKPRKIKNFKGGSARGEAVVYKAGTLW